METGCSSDNTALNEPASLSPLTGHDGPVASIFQLPAELVIKLFQFTLPRVDMLKVLVPQLLSYMRTLYAVRLIAKRSQEIVDGTPTFWKFVVSTWPPHVNEATISRSKNGSLTVIYPCGMMHDGKPQPSAEDFLGSLAHTFPRWSAYDGPLVSGYFHTPAPQLQAIALMPGETSIGALDLLGGSAEHLRHVALFRIPIRWKTGLFTQLKVLKLVEMSHELTTTHLLDALQASPCLERLELGCMRGPIDHPPSSPVITHLRLRCIKIYDCRHSFAGAILRHIRAPFCTKFYVNEKLANVEQDLPTFLNEGLQNFNGPLRAIHSHNRSSKITFRSQGFEWRSPAKDPLPTFDLFVYCHDLLPCIISWVEDVLQDDSGLTICFHSEPRITHEVLESIKSMRCVTRLELLQFGRSGGWSLLVLKFIGVPLRTDPSSPPLPCLRELRLTSPNWASQTLLDMVRSRFDSSLWQGTERTPLKIEMSRGTHFRKNRPRLIFDLTNLTKIRDTDGVKCVQFLGSEELDGTLAITWDEEEKTPA